MKKEITVELFKPEIAKIANLIKKNAIKIIDKEKLVVSGTLRRSIVSEVHLEVEKPYIVVYVAQNDKLMTSKDMKYPRYLHEGIEPHMPPIAPIKKWILKKGIIKNELEEAWQKSKKKRTFNNYIDNKLTSVAWAIAMNMKKKGKKPVPFLELAIKMTLDQLS